MPCKKGTKEIIKKDKKIWIKSEKAGQRRGKDRLYLRGEKSSKDQWL